jgi:hypothetical protein
MAGVAGVEYYFGHTLPRIEDGKVIPCGKNTGDQNPHAEMPGVGRNATAIHHPGPMRFS